MTYAGYRDRNMGGKPPRHFYSVPCVVCRAEIGERCIEVSTWERSRRKKWTQPHKQRITRVRRVDEYKE
jgi:hypothetical protein